MAVKVPPRRPPYPVPSPDPGANFLKTARGYPRGEADSSGDDFGHEGCRSRGELGGGWVPGGSRMGGAGLWGWW